MGACKAQKLYSSIDEMLGVRDRGCLEFSSSYVDPACTSQLLNNTNPSAAYHEAITTIFLVLVTWGTVKIMVPFWVPIIIRGLIRGLI